MLSAPMTIPWSGQLTRSWWSVVFVVIVAPHVSASPANDGALLSPIPRNDIDRATTTVKTRFMVHLLISGSGCELFDVMAGVLCIDVVEVRRVPGH